jgi:hypothetical protein
MANVSVFSANSRRRVERSGFIGLLVLVKKGLCSYHDNERIASLLSSGSGCRPYSAAEPIQRIRRRAGIFV